MGRRIHTLFTEAWHLVLLVAAGGLCLAGVAALIGYAAGKRGGHEVTTVAIAIGAVGIVSVLTGVASDPMGRNWSVLTGSRHAFASVEAQGELMREMEHGEAGLSPETKQLFRQDDLLYAGGVMLIGLAVLFAFVCKWAGVPPASPFHR